MNNANEIATKDTIHLISHTHWDREWYFSFQHFRYRLVHLINQLLDYLPDHPNFKHFHLDGQSIAVEDYLEVEPERKEELVQLIRDGRILVGPWYVLADEFLVSGESLIRNLLLGIRHCEQLGGHMNIGYLPDLFGHIGQMPQILQGFGLSEAILWRGISDQGEERVPSEWIWRGLDGSEILAFHLPDRYGYANGSELPYDKETLRTQLDRLHTELKPYTATKHLLLMNGTDHQLAHFPIPELVDGINQTASGYEVIQSTLPDYIAQVKHNLSDRSALRVYAGELRATNYGQQGKFNFVLPNVLSSRIYLKLWNEHVQTLLERWAEPAAVLAHFHGNPYPQSLLRTAWKYLLQNHPHDSICGCSIDDVHRQMITRFEWANDIAGQVVQESLYALTKRVAIPPLSGDERLLHVFNILAFEATEAVEAEVHLMCGEDVRDVMLFDENDKEVPVKLLGMEKRWVTPNFMEKWPPSNAYQANVTRISLLAETVPAFGFNTYRVKTSPKPNRKWVQFSQYRAQPTMENDYLKVTIHGNGSIDLLDKETGKTYERLHIFEDGADIGDGYTYSESSSDQVMTTYGEKASIRQIEHTPIRTVYEILIDWQIPKEIGPNNRVRMSETATCRIVTRLQLAVRSRRLDIETTFDNQARDHRLRVLFPTYLPVEVVDAEGSFGVDRRSIHIAQPDRSVWLEDEPVVFPHKGFIDLSSEEGSIALIAPGLPEFEVSKTEERVIALTLLRAVGYLGAGKRPLTIVSGAGPEMETMEAQCIGQHHFRYSIYPHSGDWQEGRVFEQAQLHKVGLRGFQHVHTSSEGDLSLAAGFLDWDEPTVQFSALKKTEQRNSFILRLFNPGLHACRSRVRIRMAIREAYLVDLKEDRIERISLETKSDSGLVTSEWELPFGPGQIVTLELVGS